MRWNVNYDYAGAVILLTLLIHYMFHKRLKTVHSGIFVWIMIIAFASDLLDISSVCAITYIERYPVWIGYFFNMLYLVSINLLPMLHVIYFMVLFNGKLDLKSYNRLLLFFPFFVSLFYIFITPFTGFVFVFQDKVYMRGPGMGYMYLNSMFYLILVVVLIIKYSRFLGRSQRMAFNFYVCLNVFGHIFGYFNQKVLLTGFVISLCVLIIYLLIENPADNLNRKLDVFNRSAFVNTTQELIRHKKEFVVVGIYSKGVQLINETCSIDLAESIIKEYTDLLVRIKHKHKLFHFYGVKFALILECSEQEAFVIINDLMEQTKEKVICNKKEIKMNTRFCYIKYPEHTDSGDDLIDIIECFEKEQEESFKNNIYVVQAEKVLQLRKRREIQQAVDLAIENNGFQVYYQPIISTKTNKVVSAEALVRLFDEKIGNIPPDEFISYTEKNGSIIQVGEFVLERVCQFIAQHEIWKYGIESMEVNLSGVQCSYEGICENLWGIIDRHGLDRTYFNFEITETAAVDFYGTFEENMKKFQMEGSSFSLDDYGTGFSNTINMIQYPYKLIKIDKSIIWSSVKDEKAKDILYYTVKMIKALNMGIVAEGVETEEQLQLTTQIGCDFIQGFYYARPLNEEDFLAYIRKQNQLDTFDLQSFTDTSD